jgi:hypothetical protein
MANDGGYIGVVHLLHLQSGEPKKIETDAVQDMFKAASIVMDRAIQFLCETFGLQIVDPNYTAITKLEEIEKVTKKR